MAKNEFVIKNGVLEKYKGKGGDVVIPEGVTKIGEYAFYDCSKLTNVNFSEGVTVIGRNAFSGCSKLTSVNISESVTEIGEDAFWGCSKLTSVNIPENVTVIGERAFWNCSKLTSVNIPEGVTVIGESAFRYCSSLTSVNIPEGVTKISESAFNDCSSLTSVNIPEGVTEISESAFSGCSSLKSLNIPDGVTEIGSSAFSGCSSLTSVNIPESVTEIGSYAFYKCSSLTSANIPESITEIGGNAFNGTPFFEDIKDKKGFYVINGILLKYSGNENYVNIPESVTEIGSGAFYKCSSLTSVNIPEGVTVISECTFYGCRSLTSVNIPESVTVIGGGAFAGCNSLKSLNIPDGVTEIGSSAFSGCSSLTSVNIPENVTEIGKNAFYGCRPTTVKGLSAFLIRGGKIESNDLSQLAEIIIEGGNIYPDITAVYLFNSSKTILSLCKPVLDADPAGAFRSMAAMLSEGKFKPAVYKKAVSYALEFVNSVEPADIRRLYDAMTANKQGKSAEELKPYLPDEKGEVAKQTYDDPILQKVHDMFTEYAVNTKLEKYDMKGVKYKDGGEAPEFAVKCVFYAYASQLWERPKNNIDHSRFSVVPEADEIAAALDQSDFHALIGKYANDLSVDDMFIFAPLCRYADNAQISAMAANLSTWKNRYTSNSAGYSAIIVMRGALLLSDTREAMMRADKLQLLDEYASLRGTTAQLLRDTVMIDFGLDENGEKLYDLGGTTVKAYMEKDLSVALFDVTHNKAVKSLPKRNADTEKYEKCSADLKDIKKNIKKAVSERAKRLKTDFLTGSSIPAADWKKIYLDNAVMRRLAVTLVWRTAGKKKCFIPDGSGKLILSDGSSFALPEKESVCLAHPMDIPAGETENWKKYLTENNISQAFTQMFEPVYDLSKDDIANHYEGIEIPLYRLRGLENDGLSLTTYSYDRYIMSVSLEGKALEAGVKICEEIDISGGLYSINSLPAKVSVSLTHITKKENAKKKRLNHEIFVLDKLFIEAAVRGGRIESLEAMTSCITEKNIDLLIEAAQEAGQIECLTWLMSYKNDNFGFSFPDLVLE